MNLTGPVQPGQTQHTPAFPGHACGSNPGTLKNLRDADEVE